jgi:hypothetical protein
MDRSSHIVSTVRNTFGTLAVAAALAFSWPGVQVAQAEPGATGAEFDRFMEFVGETPRAVAASPETCHAGEGLQAAEAQVTQVMAAMKRRADEATRMRLKTDGEAPAIIMLNSRGYNYGAAPDAAAELGQLHQEIARRAVPSS